MSNTLLDLNDLVILRGAAGRSEYLVSRVSLNIARGEIVGLVGVSGSGKSLTAQALLGLSLVRPGIVAGRLSFAGKPVYDAGDPNRIEERSVRANRAVAGDVRRRSQSVRGKRIGMIFQEPTSALDPLQTVRWHIDRALRTHAGVVDREVRQQKCREWIERVSLPDPERMLEACPGQISPGQCQRVMIASVLAADPDLIIADEATTALDAMTESGILEILVDVDPQKQTSILLITHNVALAVDCCHRIYEMGSERDRGTIVREYRSRPEFSELLQRHLRPEGNPPNPDRLPDKQALLSGKELVKVFGRGRNRAAKKKDAVPALGEVEFEIRSGEAIGVVGESGCGKTTLARVLTRLEDPTSGQVFHRGRDVTELGQRKLRPMRFDVRLLFQSPDAALNPGLPVREILADAVRIQERLRDRLAIEDRVRALSGMAELKPEHLGKYPRQLSGGEMRKVMLARSLAGQVALLIADEPVSGVDLGAQNELIRVINRIREDRELALVVITHDLSILLPLCDRVVVMRWGRIVEEFPLDEHCRMLGPHHPYSQRLYEASIALRASKASALRGGAGRAWLHGEFRGASGRKAKGPASSGCPHRNDCLRFEQRGSPERCERENPELRSVLDRSTHRVACHF